MQHLECGWLVPYCIVALQVLAAAYAVFTIHFNVPLLFRNKLFVCRCMWQSSTRLAVGIVVAVCGEFGNVEQWPPAAVCALWLLTHQPRLLLALLRLPALAAPGDKSLVATSCERGYMRFVTHSANRSKYSKQAVHCCYFHTVLLDSWSLT